MGLIAAFSLHFIMLMKQAKFLLLLSLGVFLMPNVVESRCTCIRGEIINDYCCLAAHSATKDACCHVDGLAKNPPILVDPTGTEVPPGGGDEPNDCTENDACKSNEECPPQAGKTVKCTSCTCLYTEINGQCDDQDACQTDADCDADLNCSCKNCMCDCEMSPGGCEGRECAVSEDCNAIAEEGMVCICEGCTCYCEWTNK